MSDEWGYAWDTRRLCREHVSRYTCLFDSTYAVTPDYWHLRRQFVVRNVWFVETIRLWRHACIFLVPEQGVMQLGEPLACWLTLYVEGVVQQTAARVKRLVTTRSVRKKGCLIVENVWWSRQDSPRCICQSVTPPLITSDCQVTSIACSYWLSWESPCSDKWTPTKNGNSRESVSCHVIWRKPKLIRNYTASYGKRLNISILGTHRLEQ
jgi:hypothetical protein